MNWTLKQWLFFLLYLGVCSGYGHAHPHSWISLHSEFILDDKGNLTEIRQRWDFDIYYSMMTLADVTNEYGDQQTGLANMAKTMAQNLAGYRYFSHLTVSGKDIQLPAPNYYELKPAFTDGQQILSLYMHFTLETPQPMQGNTINWSVFDPTYYIDISHGKVSQVAIHTTKAMQCTKDIKVSEPSEDIIEYAANLDQTQKDTRGLGDYFAEHVLIKC